MKSGWTEVDEEVLRALWDKGLSAQQISTRLGCRFSRNAVIGKVHRMGLPLRGTLLQTRARTGPKSSKPPLIKNPQASQTSGSKPRVTKPIPAEPLPPTPADDIARKILSVDFARKDDNRPEVNSRDECMWPVGDPSSPNFGFCGLEKQKGASYCAHHHWRSRHNVISVFETSSEKKNNKRPELKPETGPIRSMDTVEDLVPA